MKHIFCQNSDHQPILLMFPEKEEKGSVGGSVGGSILSRQDYLKHISNKQVSKKVALGWGRDARQAKKMANDA